MSATASVLDVHSHCVPESFIQGMDQVGTTLGAHIELADTKYRLTTPGGYQSNWFGPEMTDTPARIARMAAAGVGRTLLSSFIGISVDVVSPDGPVDYARLLNNSLAEEVGHNPDAYFGMASVPMVDPTAAARELRRTRRDLGFVGAQLAAQDLSDPELDEVWATAEELQSILLIHPGAAGTSSLPFFLGNFIGNPYETSVAAASILFGGVFDRFPDLRIILVHAGGFLPYQIGRLAHGHQTVGTKFGSKLAASSSIRDQLRKFYFDTILHDHAALKYFIDTVGLSQVVLGSDDPFPMGCAKPVDFIDSAPYLSDDEKQAILWGNAQRLIDGVRT